MLAWIPFLQPAPGVPSWWWLLVLPLSLFVSMAWKAVRQQDLAGYCKLEKSVRRIRIGLFVALAIVVRVIVPIIPSE